MNICKKILPDLDQEKILIYVSEKLSEYAIAFDDGTEIISEVFSSYFGGKPNMFENKFIEFMEESEKYDSK